MNFGGNNPSQVPSSGRLPEPDHEPSAALIDQTPAGAPWGLKQDALVAEPVSERDGDAVVEAGPAPAMGAVRQSAEICCPDRRGSGQTQGYCQGKRSGYCNAYRCDRGFVKHGVSLGWRVIKPLQTRLFWAGLRRLGRLPCARLTDISATTSTSR